MSAVAQETKPLTFKNLDWDVLWERYGIAAVLLIGWILAILFVPKFSNPDNMLNVIRQSAFIGCAAVGMTIADLSLHKGCIAHAVPDTSRRGAIALHSACTSPLG